MKLLSVIVPIYNSSLYLRHCIGSILSQDYHKIQLILVNDGSTDSSLEICNEFKNIDERVYVINQKNSGPFTARRNGVLAASGDYITFVDSDDFIANKSFSLASDNMDDDIDVICFGINRYKGRDNIIRNTISYKDGKYDAKEIIKEVYPTMLWNTRKNTFGLDPSLCTKLIKKDILNSFYDKCQELNFHYGEDAAVLYPVLLKCRSMFIHSECYYYHRHWRTEPASYIADEAFIEKSYLLYSHLKKYMTDNIFKEQIEEIFINAVNIRKRSGKEDYFKYLFPYSKIKKGTNILIYGAGKVGNDYVKQIKKNNYCKIVGWIDKNYQKCSDGIISLDSAIKKDFELIVIAINNRDVCNIVLEELLSKNVPKDKIFF